MDRDFIEYTFTMADGSKAYEFVQRSDCNRQMHAFKRMHGAVSAMPSHIERELSRINKPLRPRKPQQLDTTALPLFGDGHTQQELF